MEQNGMDFHIYIVYVSMQKGEWEHQHAYTAHKQDIEALYLLRKQNSKGKKTAVELYFLSLPLPLFPPNYSV